MDTPRRFSPDELAALAGVNRRTVRFYVQEGLLDRPRGAGRGAYYTEQHLSRLLDIRRWQQAGISLERIRELLQAPAADLAAVAQRPRPGSVEVRSHVTVTDGVELVVAPARAGLTSDQLRRLAEGVATLLQNITGADE